jgi:antitoxin YefM
MLTIKANDLITEFKRVCDAIWRDGEAFIIPRPQNENVVILSEHEYQELLKAKRNADYIAKLDRGLDDIKQGKGIQVSLTELRAMDDE